MSQTITEAEAPEMGSVDQTKPRKSGTRISMIIRRTHLYAGLFLVPWVLLYGITGAMYNHRGLFPDVAITNLGPNVLQNTAMDEFPTPAALAQQVVDSLQAAAPDSSVTLMEQHGAEFTGEVVFEVHSDGTKHAVHIDPISQASRVMTHPKDGERLEPVLHGVRNIKLSANPYHMARQSVPTVLEDAGISPEGQPRPLGWCKLNFLAEVDGEPARVTYVLRDGHVDVTRHEGQDGMSFRQFMLRLHTTHGQPPHWNGKMFWSLGVDTMAIAMVTWAFSGIFMWWQIKRLRWIGAFVMVLSVGTAAMMYLGIVQFYATTKL